MVPRDSDDEFSSDEIDEIGVEDCEEVDNGGALLREGQQDVKFKQLAKQNLKGMGDAASFNQGAWDDEPDAQDDLESESQQPGDAAIG
eukprot:5819310-Pyramimonas_sp.AAC.1